MAQPVEHIIQHLNQVNVLRDLAERGGLLSVIQDVQNWQCERLIASHQGMWNDPRFRPAMEFFVDELYGPKDFSQRDQDIARVVPKLAKVLPEKAILSLEAALNLNRLSFELDFAMAQQLQGQTINRESYAAAYVNVGREDDRVVQINVIELLGDQLADVVRFRGISTLIKLARKPAKLAGLLSLHEFLEAGYHAFKKLGDVHEFIDPIVEKERAIMHALLHDDTNPLPEQL
ncbi:FFLEELY motif protein [Aestuariibacter salexigens]|uniref:FFLEELY motif protein n=1 Tax=Aestuariibacter salexigens TaxID=226010 RepID=UPI0004241068|nr:hypothetical protein [Aestuariibacter salexigens]